MQLPDDAIRLKQALDVFAAVVMLPTADQAAAVSSRCNGDARLVAEVEAMLRADASTDPHVLTDAQADTFLEHSTAGLLAGPIVGAIHEGESVNGAYRILRLIGEGGMGAVYEAEQLNPRRRVALKVLRPGRLSERSRLRFQYEAHLMGRLEHPNIARLYEANMKVVSGQVQAYLAMELIDGTAIDRFVRDRNLASNDIIALFLPVCDAIEHAHRAGIIHRDLKPANIIVDTAGLPKVLDFGVARNVNSDSTSRAAGVDVLEPRDQTLAGELIGTVAYMAPEQIDHGQVSLSAGPVDTRADVYSLGVILFKLLTSSLPIDVSADPFARAIHRVLTEDPKPLSSKGKRFAKDLDVIVARALEKDRQRRYSSVAALREDLTRYLSGLPIVARSDSALYVFRKVLVRHWTAVASVAVFVFLVTAFGVYSSVQSRQSAKLAARAELSELSARESERRAIVSESSALTQQYSANIGYAAAAMASNDSVRVMEQLNAAPPLLRDWEWHYLRAAADTTSSRTAFQGEPPQAAAISPDQRYVACGSPAQPTLVITDLMTGKAVHVHGLTTAVPRATFSPTSTEYAYAGDLNEVTVRRTGDGSLVWSHVAEGKPVLQVYVTTYSTDGRLLFVGAFGGGKLFDATNGSVLWSITPDSTGVAFAAFSPDAAYLYLVDATNRLRKYDVATGQPVATLHATGHAIYSIAISPDGRRLAVFDSGRQVLFYDLETDAPVARSASFRAYVPAMTFSADSRSLFVSTRHRVIEEISAANGRTIRTFRGAKDWPVRISVAADKTTLLYLAADRVIYRWDLAGRYPLARLPIGYIGTGIRVSRDGTKIITAAYSGDLTVIDRSKLAVVKKVAQGQHRITGLDIDPSGQQAAFCTRGGGIYLWDLGSDSAPPRRLQLATSPKPLDRQTPTPNPTRSSTAAAPTSASATQRSSPATPSSTTRPTPPVLSAVAFTPDGKVLVAVGEAGELLIFPTSSYIAETPVAVGGWSNAISVSPDSRRVAIGTSEGSVKVVDLQSRRVILQRKISEYGLTKVAFSPDGKTIAASGDVSLLTLLNASDLSTQAILSGHQGNVYSVAFNPSGSRLVSSGDDGTIRLWDPTKAVEVLVMRDVPGAPASLVFSPSGDDLLATSNDNYLYVLAAGQRK